MKKEKSEHKNREKRRILAWLLTVAVIVTTPVAARAYEVASGVNYSENDLKSEEPQHINNFDKAGRIQSAECLGEVKKEGRSGGTALRKADRDIQLRAAKHSYAEAAFDETSVDIAAILNRQMENYFSGGTKDKKAEITTYRKKNGMNSSITFDFIENYYMTFPISNSNLEASNRILRWVNTAISNYPNFCTMHSTVSYTYTVDDDNKRYLAGIVIYSPLEAGDIKTVTEKYKQELASLIQVPQKDTSMTEAERILYVHDKIVTMADYGTGESMEDYIPAGVLLNHKGVCQSYAYVMNQALADLGIDSLYLVSDSHAWNGVKLNGKWYYVDATWDDPVGNVPISFVMHTYLLSNPSVFTEDHTLTTEYQNTYGSILDAAGKAYDNYLPKTQDANGRSYNRAFDYAGGVWYVSDRIHIYTWDGKSDTTSLFSAIRAGSPEVCTAVKDGVLYYSTPEGIFRYNKDGTDTSVLTGNVTAFVFRGADMDYQIDGQPPLSAATPTPFVVTPVPTATVWEEPPLVVKTATPAPTASATQTAAPTVSELPTAAPTASAGSTAQTDATNHPAAGSPSVTQTPGATGDTSAVPDYNPSGQPARTALPLITATPGTSQQPATVTPAPTQTSSTLPANTSAAPATVRPGKGAITKLSNYASKKIRVTIKRVKNATGYQIWYSTDKKFKKAVKKKDMKTQKCVVKKLKKKTYYVKVRAYVKDASGKRVYGAFSKTKKIRVKK